MTDVRLLLDEHVPRVFATTLSDRQYTVIRAQVEYGQETVDRALIDHAADTDAVLLTNDRDFVRIGSTVDHNGLIIYNDIAYLREQPASAVAVVDRVFDQYPPDGLQNAIVWFDDWR